MASSILEWRKLVLIGLKLANSKINEGRSRLERNTFETAEEVIFEDMLLLIYIVHDC